MNRSLHEHRPPHAYLDRTWYLLTSSTLERAHFLACDEAKALVRDAFQRVAQRFDMSIRAWVVLDNHYHLLLRTKKGQDLSRFVAQLHGSTSRQINSLDNIVGRRIWLNYWDSCMRTETELWTRFNYVHNNPVKHGYVQSLEDWPFSSYHYYLRTKGKDWLDDCWMKYPVIDYLEGDEVDGISG